MKKLALLATVLLLASCSASGGESVATEGGKTTTTEAGGKTTTTEGGGKTTTTEGGGKTTTTEGKKSGGSGDIEVSDIGFTAYKDYSDELTATAGAELTYDGDGVIANFQVIFTFTDKADKVVGTETSYVYAIGADAVAYAEVNNVSLQGQATKVSAEAVVDEDMSSYYDGSVLPVTVNSVTKDTYSGPVVKGTVKNTTKDVVQGATVDCVLLDGKKIVAGASGYLDTLTPGKEGTFETYGFYEGLKADKAKCSSGSYG